MTGLSASTAETATVGNASPPAPPVARPRRKRRSAALMSLLLAAAVAAPTAYLIRGTGLKTSLFSKVVPGYTAEHPYVTLSRPAADSSVVPCNVFVAVDVMLPNAGAVVDPATIDSGSVRLIRKLDNSIVPARVNTSAAGDALVLQPDQPLDPNTFYRFEILPSLKDTSGASFKPYRFTFTTGGSGNAIEFPVAFEKIDLPQTHGHVYTSVTVGPDGRLYAGTYEGDIVRFSLNSDGTVAAVDTIDVVRRGSGETRLITGICFDPDSTAEQPVLYVSHGQCTRTAADEWTGKLSRLTGPDLGHYQDVLVGFPRASRDHLNNQMAFGPDGALYLANGSNSSMGAADATWGLRPERKLSACIMRIDLAAIGQRTLDIRTDDGGGPYNPFAPAAPVTVYASGVRSSYDLTWTRDGRLFASINGSAAGGNTPVKPNDPLSALQNLRLTIPDHLALIEAGGYYGHPNPSRGQYILMGGNPTADADPVEVNRYPVGTQPEVNWKPPVAEFGSNLAPCGMIEYRGGTTTETLDRALMVCRFSGGKDICLFIPDERGHIRHMMTGIEGLNRFQEPIDLIQHPQTGHLYVAEFGGKRVTLIRALAGGISRQVYLEQAGASRGLLETPQRKPVPGQDTEDEHVD